MSTSCLDRRSDLTHARFAGLNPPEALRVDDPGTDQYVIAVLAAAGSWLELPEPVRAAAAAATAPGVPSERRCEALGRAVAAARDTLPPGQVRRLAEANRLARQLTTR